MSTAVEEPVAAASMVAAPERVAVFMARRTDLVLVIVKERIRHDAEGNPIETLPGKRIRFQHGVLRVPLDGEELGDGKGHVTNETGEDLPSGEVIAALRKHRLLGDREEGFWEHHEAPPEPTEAEQNRLAELAGDSDVEGLAEFIEQEEHGWRREKLLTVARGAHSRAARKRQELAEEIERAEQRGRAAAKAPAAKKDTAE